MFTALTIKLDWWLLPSCPHLNHPPSVPIWTSWPYHLSHLWWPEAPCPDLASPMTRLWRRRRIISQSPVWPVCQVSSLSVRHCLMVTAWSGLLTPRLVSCLLAGLSEPRPPARRDTKANYFLGQPRLIIALRVMTWQGDNMRRVTFIKLFLQNDQHIHSNVCVRVPSLLITKLLILELEITFENFCQKKNSFSLFLKILFSKFHDKSLESWAKNLSIWRTTINYVQKI